MKWNFILRVVSCGPISHSQQKFWDASAEWLFLQKRQSWKKYPSIGTLVGLLLALTWQAASALLELSSSTSSSRRGLCQQPDWASHRLGARALAPWACSWSLQGHEPNFATSSTSGSSKRFFCHQWLVCSNMLSCPWWSSEGSLAVALNWPISHQKVLVNSAACRHSCLENNRPLACHCSCWASVEG